MMGLYTGNFDMVGCRFALQFALKMVRIGTSCECLGCFQTR